MTIPRNIQEQLEAYVNNRVPPSGFLYAVLVNDLYRAVYKADEYNRAAFFDIVSHVEAQLPMIARGSAKIVRRWLERRELEPEEEDS